MRVALISVFSPGILNPSVPMGIGYLAGALRQAGHVVSTFDTGIDAMWRSELAEFNPELVGFGVLSSGAYLLPGLARQVKALYRCHVVAGGAHASLAPDDMLGACPDVDYVLVGEAEEALPRLVDLLAACRAGAGSGDTPVNSVPGLLYRSDGQVARTAGPSFISDLDSLPFPAWDLLRPDRYWVAPIVCSRGCPQRCVFCAVPVLQGRQVRCRSAESIVEEMELLVRHHHLTRFELSGDGLMHKPGVVRAICELILQKRLPVAWQVAGARSSQMDPGLLRLMRRAGCTAVHLGLESGSDAMLRQMRKGVNTAAHRRAISLIHAAGLRVVGNFVLGCPGETEQTCGETAAFLDEMAIDTVFVNLAVAYPGTELEAWVRTHGQALASVTTAEAPVHVPTPDRMEVPFETPEFPAAARLSLHRIVSDSARRSERRAAEVRAAALRSAVPAQGKQAAGCAADTPELSVVVVTKDRASYLDLTLAALSVQDLDPSRYEVIVVDDGSADDTTGVVRYWEGTLPVRVVSHPTNRGRSAARNTGLRACHAPVVLFLDDDAIAAPGLLLSHLAHHVGEQVVVLGEVSLVFNSHVTGAAAAERLGSTLRYCGASEDLTTAMTTRIAELAAVRTISPQELATQIVNVIASAREGMVSTRHAMAAYQSHGMPHAAPWMRFVTRNVSAPRAVIMDLGGFDEEYTGWGAEDIELGYRLFRFGIPFVYEPAAQVIHQEHPTSPEKAQERLGNLERLVAKHPELGAEYMDEITGPRSGVLRNLADAKAAAGIPRMETMRHAPLVWFSRPKGYGHAVRGSEILRHLADRSGLSVVIATSGSGLARFTRGEVVDLGQWAEAGSHVRMTRARDLIVAAAPQMVVCDEEPEAAYAAREMGLPVVYVTNWLAPHRGTPPYTDLRRVQRIVFADLRQGSICEGTWPMPVDYVGPVFPALPDAQSRAQIREQLGALQGVTLVTVAVGGGTEADLRLFEHVLTALREDRRQALIAVATGDLPGDRMPVSAADANVVWLRDFEEARHAMLSSDVVITRGGHTTLWELAYAGIPAVAIPHGQAVNPLNWRYVERMRKVGVVYHVTERALYEDTTLLLSALRESLTNGAWRAARERAQNLPPLQGAERAAKAILESRLHDKGT